MHTTATDGGNTIREMAEAALARGLRVHRDHRPLEKSRHDQRHGRRARARACPCASARSTKKCKGSRWPHPRLSPASRWTSCRRTLDLDDETLAQMDVVVASVIRVRPADREMTARLLRALENPYLRILGHPTGRKVLRRDPYVFHIDAVLKRAASSALPWSTTPPRSCRPERPAPAARKTARLQDHGQHRRPLHRRAGQDALRHHPAPPRMAGSRGRREHASRCWDAASKPSPEALTSSPLEQPHRGNGELLTSHVRWGVHVLITGG